MENSIWIKRIIAYWLIYACVHTNTHTHTHTYIYYYYYYYYYSVALVRERTIPTERPPPVGEVSANFCG